MLPKDYRERSDASKIYFDVIDEETGELLTPSLTVQSYAKECDINTIVAKYRQTGIVTHLSKYQGQYGDFTGILGYQEALDEVIKAEEMFMTVPATIRERFNNDPGQFLDFVTNPLNKDELIKLGLANKPQVSPPVVGQEGDFESEQSST